MRKTHMAQLYKWYVYVRPGVISYFNDYQEALDYAEANSAEVKPMDVYWWITREGADDITEYYAVYDASGQDTMNGFCFEQC
jgi:hypothetical protein